MSLDPYDDSSFDFEARRASLEKEREDGDITEEEYEEALGEIDNDEREYAFRCESNAIGRELREESPADDFENGQ